MNLELLKNQVLNIINTDKSTDDKLQEILDSNLKRYYLVAQVNNSLKHGYYSKKFLGLMRGGGGGGRNSNRDYYNY